MDDIQVLAARAAMKKMTQDGYFSICTIDNILRMTGGVPRASDYDILRALHCISFRDMEPMLLRGLPFLIKRVLEADGVDLTFDVIAAGTGLKFVEAEKEKWVGRG